MLIMGLLPRFWARVVIQDAGYETACLIWTGSKTTAGYGNLRLPAKGGYAYAHRLAFEAWYGPIPKRIDGDRAVLDHLCRNRACVNIDHLELVTNRANILRGDTIQAANAAKTHCHRGHEFTPENTGRSHKYGRTCLACQREAWRARTAQLPKKPRKPKPPRTHCMRGHEFTPESTYTAPDGGRECRICALDRLHEYRRRKRAQ